MVSGAGGGTSQGLTPKKVVDPQLVSLGGVQAAKSMGGVTPASGQSASYGSTSNVKGLNEGTTDPITGALAAYGYTPEGLASLYNNPTLLSQDVLGSRGITNPGMAQELGQYMDPAVAANMLINKGYGSTASDASTLNFVNEYMNQMATPNGRTPEFDYLINQLLAPSSQTATGSPLGAYLNAGLTPDQQVKIANAMLSQTLVGLNPYAQQAYSRAGDYFGQQYQGQVAKGAPSASSYDAYLAKNTPLMAWVNR